MISGFSFTIVVVFAASCFISLNPPAPPLLPPPSGFTFYGVDGPHPAVPSPSGLRNLHEGL